MREGRNKGKDASSARAWTPKRVALGGVFLALCLTAMFLASFAPGMEMTLLALASLAIYIFCMEAGLGAGMALYVGACLLALLVAPNKVVVLPFLLFFGLYPPYKVLVDRSEKRLLRGVLKLLFLVAALALYLWLVSFFVEVSALWRLPAWVDRLPAWTFAPLIAVMVCLVDGAFEVILDKGLSVYWQRFHGGGRGPGRGPEGAASGAEAPVIRLSDGSAEDHTEAAAEEKGAREEEA